MSTNNQEVVGGRPECRLRGNGETKYIIEIAVFNDPCLTQIPALNVFQNRIRIGKNPVVILEEDQSVTVKCVYGLPTVETMTLPIINSNFNIDNFAHPEAEIRPSNNSELSSSASQSKTSLSVDEATGESVQQSFENNELANSQSRITDSSVGSGISRLLSTQNSNNLEQFATTAFQTNENNQMKENGFGAAGSNENFNSFGSSNIDRTWPATNSGDEYGTASPQRTTRSFHDLATVMKSNFGRSNLEEFVSKTYALGEYNNMASPAYAYSSEIHDEREVDVGRESRYEVCCSECIKPSITAFQRPYEKRTQRHPKPIRNEDGAVSSFRSITEIVHAAETATASKGNLGISINFSVLFFSEGKGNGDLSDLQILMDCVLPIRGFGYRKLTEQEIIRWKNLIQQDAHIRELLASSKSSAEIENIFEHEEYKNMFTSSKWHEIALCVHRALTNSLDRSNSRSELQLFVGNVPTEW
ncbi:hypothetical protein CAEBREN_28984 [Caenorhabditis brenneri]|uniref:Uncharacterized protein n=1 Tax=Caenorhabditis brenneri TaxID=135651 RepID=G0N7N8_CAEBE|nr:hypothetical protein CAEBREN_28984 [Caenorhabditis brenneri]